MPRKKSPSPHQLEPLLLLKDVADYLQVSERTVYLWSQAGSIPSFKLGNVWRYQRTDIEAWIAEQAKANAVNRKGVTDEPQVDDGR